MAGWGAERRGFAQGVRSAKLVAISVGWRNGDDQAVYCEHSGGWPFSADDG